MLKFKIMVTKLWIKFLCPIWSFIVNLCYWINRPFGIREALLKKEIYLALPLEELIGRFKWTGDKFKDWVPWVITIANKELADDCDGAAILAKWWWKEHDIKSRIVFLYSSTAGHAVCVKTDNTCFVSNSQVLYLDSTNWQQDLFTAFDNIYSVIIEK